MTMAVTQSDMGSLGDGFPYVRVGNGPRTLLVLPGFGDAMFEGEYPPAAGWLLQSYFARYLDEYTVYLVSRPRGLPDRYAARDSADDHAEMIQSEFDAVDVIGISMGGMIATELAAGYPDLVDRLVLANTGCRLADAARPDVVRLREYALDHDWAAIRAELASALFADWRAVTYPPVVLSVGRFLQPRPAVPADVWNSLELILAYDGRGTLADIDQPTLVFGGSRDPYFTPTVTRETAAGLPNATLSLVEGAKHGAFHERKGIFDSRVTRFLARDA